MKLFSVEEQYISDNARTEDGLPLCGVGGTYYFTLNALTNGPGEGIFSIKNSRIWSGETIGEIKIPVNVSASADIIN